MTTQKSFEGQVIIVSGATGVLGKAVVSWFTQRGALVGVLGSSEASLSKAYPEPAEQHCYVTCDLTQRDSCVGTLRLIEAKLGPIDIMCNAAGGFLMGDAVHETSDATWDFLFDLNARSILNMSAAVIPSMLSRGHGKVVNVAAKASAGAANMGPYIASKAAVIRLTESMALELRGQGINVNCVMPGLIDTPRNRADMPDADFSQWVTPLQIADVIGFLVSPQAIAVHGASVPVDGLS
ncbi:MAG: NAD(P)-dependent dehydrogenase (short-subunit alcohol dehydrogenase family) [Candidatus Pseudothioglobus sp.]|jgi:NAD(P)-dependent dehydrogenase (short-subunit alcohol dehydrogenase family)